MSRFAARSLSVSVAVALFVLGDLQAQPRVAGSVVGLDGKPFAAATVELLPIPPGFAAGRLRLEGREVQPAAASTTDERGHFTLSSPEEGVYRVRVAARGRVPMQSGPLALVDDMELPPVALREDAGTSLRLVDSLGRPAAGTWIFAEPAGAAGGRRPRAGLWQPDFRIGRTDSDGRLDLPRFAGERLAVTWFETGAAAGGTGIAADEAIGHGKRDSATFTLETSPGAQRQIRIVDPEGKGLAGLLLRAGPKAWPMGLTDERGSLMVRGWPAEGLELRITDAQSFSLFQRAGAHGDQPVTVRFPAPALLAGRVRDTGNGKPVAGALVLSLGDPGSFIRSGPDGRFQQRAMTPETFWLEAAAPGYLPKRIRVSPAQMRAGRGLAFALTRAQQVRGQVVDPRGVPVPGAWISAELEQLKDRPPTGGVESFADGGASDSAGGFELRRLRSGLGYALRVERPGYLSASASVVAPDRGSPQAPLKIVLQPSPRVAGQVQDTQGRPIAGAEVDVAAASPNTRRSRTLPEAAAHAKTDGQGRFTFAEVPAAEVDLVVRKGGFAAGIFQGLRLPSNQPAVDLGKIVLRPGATVRGRVVDSRKRPIAAARIYELEELGRVDALAETLAGEEPVARGSSRGEFTLPDLPAGSAVHLLIVAEGYRPEGLRGVRVPAAAPLVVTLSEAFAVKGRVLEENGEPVAGAEVKLSWQEILPDVPGDLPVGLALSRDDITDNEGRFALSGVPAGESAVSISASGFRPLQGRKLALPQAEPGQEMTFVLERGAVLEGRVTTSDGRPVAGARIDGGPARIAASDDEGLYTLAGLDLGDAEIELSHPHFPRQRKRQAIVAGLNRLDFQLQAGQEVRGQVLDEQRKPVAGAGVRLRLAARTGIREYRARSASDGSFQLDEVADGRYLLAAEAEGYAEGKSRRPVVVTGEPVEGLEVLLPRGADLVGKVTGLDREDLWRLQVQAQDEDGRSYPAKLDTAGRYELRTLPLGNWLVKASLGGGERQAQARAELRQGGEVVERNLEFDERLRLSGSVLFLDEPLPAARVALRGERLAVERAVLTDHQGRFELEDLEPDTYWLGVSHSRKLAVYNGRLTLTADRDLVLDLKGATVQGTVVDAATDRPVPGAFVSLEHQAGPETTEFMIAAGTDEQGGFVLPRVPPGPYRLRSRAEGYVAGDEGIDIPAQDEVSGLRIALTPTPGLELAVRLASGRIPPVVHFRAVSTADGGVIAGSQPPDAEGRIRLPTPSKGSWLLRVGAPGCGAVEISAQAPGPPVSVVLPPAARLSVQVPELATSDMRAEVTLVGPNGSRPQILSPGGALQQKWPMIGGKATIEDVPAGTWIVDASAGDGRRWSTTVMASEAASVAVTLE